MEKFSSDFFIWDFWYYFEIKTNVFHVLFLNAPIETKTNDKHHFVSRIGYAQTTDFETFSNINYNVFQADPKGWDNTSIWSGDVIRCGSTFLFFYTSRDKNIDNGMTQNIGLATSNDFINWQRQDFRIKPDGDLFLTSEMPTEASTHAWRDPFLFNSDGKAMMLLSAKSKDMPDNKRGAIALLEAPKGRLDEFKTVTALLDPGYFGEMEVPQIFLDEEKNPVIGFSCFDKFDSFNKKGGFYGIKLSNRLSGKPSDPELIVPQSTNVYAARVVPELEGEIIGFDLENGGFKKSGIKVSWQHPNRNFDGFEF